MALAIVGGALPTSGLYVAFAANATGAPYQYNTTILRVSPYGRAHMRRRPAAPCNVA